MPRTHHITHQRTYNFFDSVPRAFFWGVAKHDGEKKNRRDSNARVLAADVREPSLPHVPAVPIQWRWPQPSDLAMMTIHTPPNPIDVLPIFTQLFAS